MLQRWIIVAGPPCHRSKDGCKRKAELGDTLVGMNLYSPENYGNLMKSLKNASWKTIFHFPFEMVPFQGIFVHFRGNSKNRCIL